MNVLIIQHENDTPAGTTLEWLRLHKVNYHILMASDVPSYPELTEFDGLIILGGSMNVDEEALHPWLVVEKAFVRKWIDQNKKILGLCLGSQIIADVLGARVESMNKWEIGWFDISTQGQQVAAFHWHQYSFSVPESCVLTVSSKACLNQGFTYKNHILAYQFHPEVDFEWVHLALMGWQAGENGAVQSAEQILKDNVKKLPEIKSWYFQQLESFFIPGDN